MERMVALPGITYCIDETGPADGPVVVHLEGHLAQLVATPRTYVELLARRGFRSVRVDNRDVGRTRADAPETPYTLLDLADDMHRLIEVLGGPAIVTGRSMGGMIAQLLALRHPHDVRALGLFFTAPGRGDRATGYPRFATEAEFRDFEAASLPGIAGPAFPFAPATIEELAATMWSRGVSGDGFTRQSQAMAATPPWADRLGDIEVAVAVVHGSDDPVIPVAAAHALAEAIPGATLTIVEGMGHQQPSELDPLFADVVSDLADRSGRRRR